MSSPDSSNREARKQAVLVLGMHCSGTSALAGVIGRLGAALPKTQSKKPTLVNAKGYGESTAISKFNEGLLTSTGSDWRDFEPFDPYWMRSPFVPSFARKARRLIEAEFGDAPVIVLKDPRLCRIVPFWLEQLRALGFEIYVVMSVRNPLEVAASLNRRDGVRPRIALLLWLRHVLDAEATTRHLPRAWVKYDELLSDWRGVMDRLGRRLDLSWLNGNSGAQREVDEFLTAELRHHATTPEEVDNYPHILEWAKKTYKVMCNHTGMGIDVAGRETLDDVRSSLNAACEAFSPLITTELRGSLSDLGIVSRALAKAQLSLAKAQLSNAKLSVRLQASKQKLDDYRRMKRPIRWLLLPISLWQRIKTTGEFGGISSVQKPAIMIDAPPSKQLNTTPSRSNQGDAPSPGEELSDAFQPDPQIAVVCHVYYLSLWDDLAREIRQIPPAFDLYVTIVDQPGALELSERIRSENPRSRIEIVKNHGRDIFPFLSILDSGALDKYYLICKLHTKKSPHREDGDAWRQRIFFNLLDSPKNVADILRAFNADPKLGLVGADGELYEGERGWGANREQAARVAGAIGLSLEDYPPRFVLASMFWARGTAFRPLRVLNLSANSFESECGALDGTMCHAIERLFSIFAMAGSLTIKERATI